MKKVLGIILGVLLVFTVTGCGDNKSKVKINKEYQKYIDLIRNDKAASYIGDYTLGELFDNALKDSNWDEYKKELADGTKKILISVTGKDKFNDNKLTEVVYEVNTEKMEYRNYKINVENDNNPNLITLLKNSVDELNNKKK